MSGASAVTIERRGPAAWVTLDRPERHNAFDDAVIAEFTAALEAVAADSAVRAVVIAGNGPSFSAGADLTWMKRAAAPAREANLRDALALARLMRTLAELPRPTVARVHGAALGGGFGLVCCCDIAIAAEGARFAMTEVRLGIVPGAISPYVVQAIGPRHARALMLRGTRIDAAEALRIGLVHQVVAPEQIDAAVGRTLDEILAGGTDAHAEVKRLVRAVHGRAVDDDLVALTAASIADARAGAEGREGVAAFVEKRKPSWAP
ncbi:MAG: enoyl-CoA hydratase/isomerase family protein [Alphaproteobacteria bacterium]|nr:enoyl-CoA hydratase/isomerase family protein [Alphaproteobacteria bacterium]